MSYYYRAKFENGSADYHVATELQAWRMAKDADRGPTLSVVRKRAFVGSLPRSYYATFLRRALYHVESGTSLATSFVYVIQAETKTRIKAKVQPVADAILRGSRVADALALSGLMDEAGRAMLEAGELGGNSKEVLETLISRYEASTAVLTIWKGFAIWYVVQYLLAVSGAVWIRDGMIPEMLSSVSDKPEQAAAIATVTFIINAYIYLIVWGLAMVGILVALFTKGQGAMRSWADRILRRIPGVRSLLHDPAMADTFTTAAWAIKAQLRLEQAFTLAGTAAKLPAVKEVWSYALEKLWVGATLKACFTNSKNQMLEHNELQEIAAYQNSSQVVRTFQAIANARVIRAKDGARFAFKFYTIFLTAGLLVLMLVSITLIGVTGDTANVDIRNAEQLSEGY